MPIPLTARSGFDRQPELRGDLRQRLAVAHPVGLPGHERLIGEVELGREQLRRVDRQQDRVFVGAGDHRSIVVGVQELELLERHLGQLRRALHVDPLRRLDDGEVRRVRDVVEHEPVLRGVADDVLDRLQLGQVVARLVRHLEARIVRSAALSSGSARSPSRRCPRPSCRRRARAASRRNRRGASAGSRAHPRSPRPRRGARRTRSSASARSACRSTG